MVKKIISSLLIGTAAITMLGPSKAEAVKLKIEPSATFRQSYNREHVRHYPSRRVVRRYDAPSSYYYEPYYRREAVVVYPDEYVEYYEDDYYAPRHYRSRSSGTDFGLKFKLK